MILRLDPSKPEELARLVTTGLIWNPAVPLTYKDMAVDALVEGRVPVPDNLPAGLLDHVNDLRDQMALRPLGEQT
jgi:hypothetical protein